VRQALSLAIDRQKVLDTYGYGEGTLAGPIPTYAKTWALPQEELTQMPGYGADREADLAEAKRLLAEAGYPDGEGLDIKILGSTHPAAAKLATIVQNRLKEDLGLDLEVESLEWGAFLGQVISSNFDLGVLVTDVVLDPDDILVRFYHPDVLGPVWGVTGETEPELVELVEAQSVETDVAKRQELVWEAQRMILDKAYWLYLVDRNLYDAYWNDVQGASVYPLRADYDLMNVWLDR
jgi:peptide/nickel transport system substrate-binding protein